jgi:hypothetical protein
MKVTTAAPSLAFLKPRMLAQTARAQFFCNLLDSRPLEYAGKLLDRGAEVDVSSALAHIWSQCLRSGDPKMPQLVVQAFAEPPDDSPKLKCLKRSIARVENFKTALIPELTKAAEHLKGSGTQSEEAYVRVLELLASVAEEKPQTSFRSALDALEDSSWATLPRSSNPAFPSYSPPYSAPPPRRVLEDIDWLVSLGLVGGLAAFLCGVFLYDGDLRFLSLLGDAVIIRIFAIGSRFPRRVEERSYGFENRRLIKICGLRSVFLALSASLPVSMSTCHQRRSRVR